jgi:hypothetical protein
LTRVHFVTDEAAASAAAAESKTHQRKQTSDGMRLWLPLTMHQVTAFVFSSICVHVMLDDVAVYIRC